MCCLFDTGRAGDDVTSLQDMDLAQGCLWMESCTDLSLLAPITCDQAFIQTTLEGFSEDLLTSFHALAADGGMQQEGGADMWQDKGLSPDDPWSLLSSGNSDLNYLSSGDSDVNSLSSGDSDVNSLSSGDSDFNSLSSGDLDFNFHIVPPSVNFITQLSSLEADKNYSQFASAESSVFPLPSGKNEKGRADWCVQDFKDPGDSFVASTFADLPNCVTHPIKTAEPRNRLQAHHTKNLKANLVTAAYHASYSSCFTATQSEIQRLYDLPNSERLDTGSLRSLQMTTPSEKNVRKIKVSDLEEEAEALVQANELLRHKIQELENLTREMKAGLIAAVAGQR